MWSKMRLRNGFWVCLSVGIVGMVIFLLLRTSVAWGQCSPLQLDEKGVYVAAGIPLGGGIPPGNPSDAIWDSGTVTVLGLPPDHPGGWPGVSHAHLMVQYACGGYGSSFGWYQTNIYRVVTTNGCYSSPGYYQETAWNSWQYYILAAYSSCPTCDADCDGRLDGEDTHPVKAQNLAKNLGCSTGTCPEDILAGNPANVATGNKFEVVLDLSVSTPGIPLEFRRAYNNQVPDDGVLGYGWTHNHDLSVQVVQETSPKRVIIWRHGDGSQIGINYRVVTKYFYYLHPQIWISLRQQR